MGSVKDQVFPASSLSLRDFQDVLLFNITGSPVEDNPENTVQGDPNIATADNEHAGLFFLSSSRLRDYFSAPL